MKGQIVFPQSLRKDMLSRIHYAHFGIVKCKSLARETVYWPTMNKEIEDLITNCDTCKKYQNANCKEPMICKDIPVKAWQILSADIFFLKGIPYILVVDAYSKFIEIKKLIDLSANVTIKCLKEIFARHGVPETLYTDSGTQFTSIDFTKFANHWYFSHIITSPKHHQSNGLAERHIQTVKRMLKKLIEENKDIYMGLLTYRNTPVSESGKSPAELLYNRKINHMIPSISKFKANNFKKELYMKQCKQKYDYDKHVRPLPKIEKGKIVKIKEEGKSGPHKSGVVLGYGKGPRSYLVKTEEGNVIQRNRKNLISNGKYYDKTIDLDITDNCDEENRVDLNSNETNDNNVVIENNRDNINNENTDSNYRTRSGRIVHMPSYLNDYV